MLLWYSYSVIWLYVVMLNLLWCVQIPEVASSHRGVYLCNVEYSIPSSTERQLVQQATTVFINSYQGIEIIPRDFEDKLLLQSHKLSFALQVHQGWTQERVDWACHRLSWWQLWWAFSSSVSLLGQPSPHFSPFGCATSRGPRERREYGFQCRPENTKSMTSWALTHLGWRSSNSLSFLEQIWSFRKCLVRDDGDDLTIGLFEKLNSVLFPSLYVGKGRFGKVFKGKAHGIVPHLPNLNTVAIKTAVNTGGFLATTVYYIRL